MNELPRTRMLNNEEKLRIKIINLCPKIDLEGLHLSDLQRIYDCVNHKMKEVE